MDIPVLVAIDRISDPGIIVINADGQTPEGLSYFDFSNLVSNGVLNPNELSNAKTIEFLNPQGTKFDYQLVVLGALNQAPTITSVPTREGIIGESYQYDVEATDPENDELAYSLSVAPEGMTIDAQTGVIGWTPTEGDRGIQNLTVLVEDGRGGRTEQTFDLVINDNPLNRPPVFTTAPIVEAKVNSEYQYDADALDLDGDDLTYALLSGPEGASIDSATGQVAWSPTTEQILGQDQNLDVDPSIPIIEGFTVETYTELSRPKQLTFDPAGTLYVGRSEVNDVGASTRIHAVSPGGKTVTNFGNVAIPDPDAVVFDRDGKLSGVPGSVLVGGLIDGSNGQISVIHPDQTVQSIYGPSSLIGNVEDLTIDNTGRLLFSNFGNNTVVLIENDTPKVLISQPEGLAEIAVDSQNRIFTSGQDGRIRIYDQNGQLINDAFASGLGTFPGIAFGPGGVWGNDLYAINRQTGALLRFDEVGNNQIIGTGILGDSSIAFGPDGALYISATSDDRILRITPNREVLGLNINQFPVSLTVSDGQGGVAVQNFVINVSSEEGNSAPVIVSEPVTQVTVAPPPEPESINLSNWSVVQYRLGNTGNANWAIRGDSTVVEQPRNADASIFLSDFQLENSKIEGNWRVNTRNDDDLMGFVFGYQDPEHYYLFDWKQQTQRVISNSWGTAEQGMSIKVVNADSPLTGFDLWNTSREEDARVRTIFHNDIPWEDFIDYQFSLEFLQGEFTITIRQGDTIIESVTIEDDTYSSGGFGFYNSSQGNLLYSGLTRANIPVSDYFYDAEAIDPDGDSIAYELVDAPDGMTIDPSTGEIKWNVTNDISTSDSLHVTVQVRDNRGGLDEQSFVLEIIESEEGEIAGIKYNDINGDGKRALDSFTELGLDDWTIYIDSNDNSRRDSNEIFTTTDENGNYRFTNLGAGEYIIREEIKPGWRQTFPNNSELPEFLGVGFTDGELVSMNPNTGEGELIANTELTRLEAIELDEQGIFYAIESTNRLVKIDPTNGSSQLVGNVNGYEVEALAFHNGIMYGTGSNNGGSRAESLITIDLETGAPTLIGIFDNGIDDVDALAISPSGLFYGADLIDRKFFTINPTNAETTIIADSPELLIGMDFSENGSHFATTIPNINSGPSNLVEVDPVSGDITAIGSTNFNTLTGLVIPPDRGTDGAYRIDLETGEIVEDIDFGNQFTGDSSPNTAPNFISEALSFAEVNKLFRYNAEALDSDGDTLTYDLVVAPEGMAIDSTLGIVVWKPSLDQVDTHDVLLRVRDGQGGIDLQAFQVTVSQNTAPVITTQPLGSAIATIPYYYDVDAQDAEQEELVYSLLNTPNGVEINPESGVLTWTPSLSDVGDALIELQVSDAEGAIDIQAYTLSVLDSVVNDAPIINSNPRTSIGIEDIYVYRVEANDPNGDPLTYTLIQAPVGMTIADDGLIQWTPEASDLGTQTINIQVEDGRGGLDTQTFDLNVVQQTLNKNPSIDSTPILTATVGENYAYDAIASDPDNDPLVWTLVAAPLGLSLNPDLGTIRWTPIADQIGTHKVVLQATDAQGGDVLQEFDITVLATNIPPQLISTPPTSAYGNEDYIYQVWTLDKLK